MPHVSTCPTNYLSLNQTRANKGVLSNINTCDPLEKEIDSWFNLVDNDIK